MAYDPKAYLNQALKTGFESVYSQPSSLETGEAPRYEGDVATFGNVQVRPLMELIGASEQDTGTPQQSGHVVSVPLTGQYQGYFRNDIYDNDGNFVNTTLTEPDDDKNGLKSLTQLGLMAASLGGFGPVAQGLASAYKGIKAAKSGDWLSAAASILPNVGLIPGVSTELAGTLKTAGDYAKTASALEKAIESKDVLGLLSAASDIPGVPQVPSDITDVLKGVGQANRIREAIRSENPSAIFNEIVGASKAGGGPGKGFFPGYETPGEIQEGFFAPGGEGYVEPDAGELPTWALDPYKDETKPGDYYAGLDRVINEWDEADIIPDTYDTTPKTTMSPNDMSKFLEANIDDPGTIDTLMQDYFPELYSQRIDVTGTLPKADVIIPDWDVLPPAVEPPKSIRDVGNVTKISPDEKLEGTDITEPDLTTGLPKAVVSPAPKPADQGRAPTSGPTPSPAPKAEDKKTDLSALFALLGAMGGQQPTQAPSPYQTARIDAESPFGLMYGLES